MKRSSIIFLIATLAIVISSCQKEVDFPPGQNPGPVNPGNGNPGNNNNKSIVGEYDFINLSAHTLSTVTVNQSGQQLKGVTVSDYITFNNTGTVKITSNQFISTDLRYDIDTMMNVKTYLNGVLMDDSDVPFIASIGPSSSTSSYVKNSADSITVTGFFGSQSTSGTVSNGPSGLKISWANDTLILKTYSSVNQSISQGGVPAQLTGYVSGVMRMKKK